MTGQAALPLPEAVEYFTRAILPVDRHATEPAEVVQPDVVEIDLIKTIFILPVLRFSKYLARFLLPLFRLFQSQFIKILPMKNQFI